MKKRLMKYQLWLWFSIVSLISHAQGGINVSTGAAIKITGGASLVLNNMHLTNNGMMEQNSGDGIVNFMGASNSTLAGNGNTIFDRLFLNKESTALLLLQNHIEVKGTLHFNTGLLDLGNYSVNLRSMGILSGESENSRAFTNGIGFLQATRILNAPTAVDVAGLGVTITSASDPGLTLIRRGHAIQTNISGTNSSIKRYFDIFPGNNTNLNAILHVRYFDAELNGADETTLNFFKSLDNVNWTSVTASLRDGLSNVVQATGISDFSRWTLGNTGVVAPVLTLPSNITVNTDPGACAALVSLTGSYAATATGLPAPAISYRIGLTDIGTSYNFPKGITTVNVTASNGVLPNATGSFTVTVVDNQPPVVTFCPAPQVLCHNSSNLYTIPAIVAGDANSCGPLSYSYVITGATQRTGTGADASGSFNVGTHTITWAVKDGSNNSATCSVNVIINSPISASIPDAFAIQPGGAPNTVYIGYAPSITLKGSVNGGSTPYTFKWTAESSAGPGISNTQTLTVSPARNTTYYFNVKDMFGCAATYATKTINVEDVRCGADKDKVSICILQKKKYDNLCVEASTVPSYLTKGAYLGNCSSNLREATASDSRVARTEKLVVFVTPNPSDNQFNLRISSPVKTPLTIKVFDALGRLKEVITVKTFNNSISIGRHYARGIYFAEVLQGVEKQVLKLVKQ